MKNASQTFTTLAAKIPELGLVKGRADALVTTFTEIAAIDALADLDLTESDLLIAFKELWASYGAVIDNADEARRGPLYGRRQTLRDLTYARIRTITPVDSMERCGKVWAAIAAHYKAQDGGRAAAVARTFAREADLLTAESERMTPDLEL